MLSAKVDSEPSQISKQKLYVKTVIDFNFLTIIEKISPPDAQLGSECTPECHYQYWYCFCQLFEILIQNIFKRVSSKSSDFSAVMEPRLLSYIIAM